jgi:3-isopropylmalate/(R)-2-methylmalate dehydratase small subunit
VTPFRRLTGVAAPLPIANVDTDMILPAAFLKTVSRRGLGRGLFHNLRAGGDFVLDRAPWSEARILVTLDNFGCGSSREHAVWALADFGISCILAPGFAHAPILLGGPNFGCGSSREHAVWALHEYGVRAVIAPSFAPIFRGNCVRNGIIPVVLPEDAIEAIAGEGAPVTIDLPAQTVAYGPLSYSFEIDPSAKAMLAEGLDAIDLTFKHRSAIAAFQARDRAARPWVYLEDS